MPSMLSNTPPKILAMLAAVMVALIVAEVILIIDGHTAEALSLPVVVGAVVPAIAGQNSLHEKADENASKLNDLLNGGTEQAVRNVVRTELATLVAKDETAGTTTVADAGANLPKQPPDRGQGHYTG